MLFVQDKQETFALPINNIPYDFEERQASFYLIGAGLRVNKQVGDIQQIVFVSEAWFSQLDKDETQSTRPSQDLQRKEVLILSQVELQSGNMQVRLLEMKRNKKGKLVALALDEKLSNPDEGTSRSSLLDALLFGYLNT